MIVAATREFKIAAAFTFCLVVIASRITWKQGKSENVSGKPAT